MSDSIFNLYREQLVTSISAAVFLIASLAWNNVIQGILEKCYPDLKNHATIKARVIYALVITFIVILIQVYIFSKL